MHLPKPPFIYERSDALIFQPGSSDDPALLLGCFPVAPTGPFREIWTMKQGAGGAWTVRDIYVNNRSRWKAGRVWWNMPKQYGPVAVQIQAHRAIAYASAEHTQLGFDVTWREATPLRDVSFRMNLSLPMISAGLTFQRSAAPVEAVLTSGCRRVTGRLIRLQGTAVLSEPVKLHRSAA